MVVVCWSKCAACTYGYGEACPGGEHGWADEEDREHARQTGQPEPTGLCGCPCAKGPVLEQREPDPEDYAPVWVSLDGEPCPTCGADGACGYDAEGRALIHATAEPDREPA